ncbi:CopG family transcriptional regulator [Xanthomonas bonasiae]|uniref:ribbon-helix-helix domain-containing protein n=1 Tax=Xanthomonas bonasiae TaxID=2810351 RepID=UPI00197F0714|nr:CopG family transcriptional regulator [Xanthomonas bonasiae]MBN6111405.1 hypothetical protein [Xanthomonas bonasiae]
MSNSYVLRTLYIDPKLDERLKREAYVANVSKNELIRKYLEIGISAVDNGETKRVSASVSGFDSQDASPTPKGVPESKQFLRRVRKSAAKKAVSPKKLAGSKSEAGGKKAGGKLLFKVVKKPSASRSVVISYGSAAKKVAAKRKAS